MILLMMPVIPHFASECLTKFNFMNDFQWPKINKETSMEENNEIVVQINGKKRNTVLANKDILEGELIKKIQLQRLIEKYLKNKELIKTIYVKGRLINYIIK